MSIPDGRTGLLALGPLMDQGDATEGAWALVRHAFTDLAAERIVATTMAVSSVSQEVLEKTGLHYLRMVHPDWQTCCPVRSTAMSGIPAPGWLAAPITTSAMLALMPQVVRLAGVGAACSGSPAAL
jgi:hypothetical protein